MKTDKGDRRFLVTPEDANKGKLNAAGKAAAKTLQRKIGTGKKGVKK